MKLNSTLIEQTVTQLDVDPIPEQHPVVPQLHQVFGDHTFFLDPDGLLIVEPSEPNASGEPTGEVVKVARWSDSDRSSLMPQPPEPTGMVVVLADGHGEPET